MLSKRKNCLNCYFCTKAFRSPDDGQEKVLALKETERKQSKQQDFNFINKEMYYLQCWKGQWSEALSGTDVQKLRSTLHKKKCPFFYYYKKGEGKFLSGIEKELDSKRILEADRIAKWSLFIAAIALFIVLITETDELSKFIQNIVR